jgi:hypothetical protein
VLDDLLDKFRPLLRKQAWSAVEALGMRQATKLASKEQAESIAAIDTGRYEAALRRMLAKSLTLAAKQDALALYFEFDLDNEWSSACFACSEYRPERAHDDEWACDCDGSVTGPRFAKFAELYQTTQGTFDGSDFSRGTTALLIARTLACTGSALKVSPKPTIPICVGYHDQDRVFRIWEPRTKHPLTRKKVTASHFHVIWAMSQQRCIAEVATRGAPEQLQLPEGKSVRTWKPVRFKVDRGELVDLHVNAYGCRLCSPRAKEIIERAASPGDGLQWLPAAIDHGKRRHLYFVLHFTRCVAALDQAKSTFFDGRVWEAVLMRKRLTGHLVLTYCGSQVGKMIVSAEVKDAMQRAGLTGMNFDPAKLV